jgi:hypothetical protein
LNRGNRSGSGFGNPGEFRRCETGSFIVGWPAMADENFDILWLPPMDFVINC